MWSLKNFFKLKGKERILSKWKNIPSNEITSELHLIDDLYNRKLDGFIIKSFLNESEVNELTNAFSSFDKDKAVHFHGREGFILPRAFSQVQTNNEFDEKLFESYLNDAKALRDHLSEELTFNFEEKLNIIFEKVQTGKRVLIPQYITNSGEIRQFCQATFRLLKTEKGGMHIHCGSMFRDIYPNFYKRLDEIINFDGQLSYFIMLQRPKKGGQLRLFDAEWVKYKKHFDDKGFVDENGTVKSMHSIDYQDIDPKSGDLLVFVGGDIWHEVTNPKEGPPRITFGGFLAYDFKRENIYLWS